ncbi:MAG: hypothetical protein KAQ92_06170 [Candidatus Aenigmarchaeota archaeon]|nr:hypothetical protein [Candidatus Aenigmarchaeota archaeon]
MNGNIFMKEAPEGKHFYFNNGKSAKNLNELCREIKKMNDEVYSVFVSPTKNDFYTWINEVLNHKELALSIKRVKKKETMIKKIDSASKSAKKNNK